MSDLRTLPVPDGLDGMRVDAGLSKLLGLSRTAVASMVETGDVYVDGHAVMKSDRLSAGTWLEVTLPAPERPLEGFVGDGANRVQQLLAGQRLHLDQRLVAFSGLVKRGRLPLPGDELAGFPGDFFHRGLLCGIVRHQLLEPVEVAGHRIHRLPGVVVENGRAGQKQATDLTVCLDQPAIARLCLGDDLLGVERPALGGGDVLVGLQEQADEGKLEEERRGE